jgi:hyaluronate lyase
MKRSIAVLIMLSMLLGVMPNIVFAAESVKTQDYDALYENLAPLAKKIDIVATDISGKSQIAPSYSSKVLIDGDLSTVYQTYSAARFATFIFAFDNKITFNKIKFYDNFRTILEFNIEISDDGKTYKQIYSYADGIMTEPTYCYFETQTANFIKLNVTKTGTRTETSYYGLSINEFEIYDTSKKVEFYRLENALKQANELLADSEKNGDTYVTQNIDELKAAVSEGKKINGVTSAKQEAVEKNVIEILKSYKKSRDFRNHPQADYEKVIYNYKNILTDSHIELDEQGIANMNALVDAAEENWNGMKKDGGDRLWDNVPSVAESKAANNNASLSTTIVNIRRMAIAATDKYSRLKGNKELIADIEYALDIYDKYWYSPDLEWFGSNLWQPLLGVPKIYSDVLILMYDEIDYDKLAYYAGRLGQQIKPDYPLFTGVNKYDAGGASAKVGAILHEDYRIDNLRKAIEEDLIIKDTPADGEGFYKDGSYIFHSDVAYSGTYGTLAYKYCVDALVILNNSIWMPNADKIKSFLEDLTESAFIPLMVPGGEIMSMVNGRAITRGGTEKTYGYGAISLVADIAELLGEPYRTKMNSRIKYILSKDKTEGYKVKTSMLVRKIMNDDSIKPADPLNINKIYRYMDKVVHHTPNMVFGLSMSSTRVIRYEQMGENLQGWFTGSGMTYFYDSDDTHYDEKFFFLADMMHLPGVTNAIAPMPIERFKAESRGLNDFAGGVTIGGQYGAAGYEISQWNSDLKGRKSYFMFDDEVVMLGSNITSKDRKYDVETTVDQRLLTDEETDNIYINNESTAELTTKNKPFENVSTAFIKGRTEGSQFGYYFPEPVTLNVNKEKVTKQGNEVTTIATQLAKKTTGTLGTLYIDHGKESNKANYAYVVLPGKTLEETESYKNHPQIEILANEPGYHGVKETNLNITALNNYEPQTASAGILTTDNISSLMVKESSDKLSFAISDPTMLVQDKINVVIDKAAKGIIKSSPRITVNSLSPKIELTVDVKGANGEGLEMDFALTDNFTPDVAQPSVQASNPKTGGFEPFCVKWTRFRDCFRLFS